MNPSIESINVLVKCPNISQKMKCKLPERIVKKKKYIILLVGREEQIKVTLASMVTSIRLVLTMGE